MKAGLLFIFSICVFYPGFSGENAEKKVTYDMAYNHASPHLFQFSEKFLAWKNDTHFFWRVKSEDSSGKRQTEYYLVSAKNGKRKLLLPEEVPAAISRKCSDHTPDYRKGVWVKDGDLFLQDDRGEHQLTCTHGIERNPRLSPDGTRVAYTRDHNLFALELATGLEKQLTSDGNDLIKNGYASWVYFEEIYGRPLKYRAFWWSPDSRNIAFMKFDDTDVDLFKIYHLGGVNGTWEATRYPKAGRTNPSVVLGVVSLDTMQTQIMDIHGDNDSYLAWPIWNADTGKLWVQWMNRDQTEVTLYEGDPATGELTPRYKEHQDTWVNFFSDLTFLKDGSFLLRTDRSGFAHLYLYNAKGELIKTLTKGDWRVEKIISVDEKNELVFFMGNRGDSLSTKLMVVDFAGEQTKILTPQSGTHTVYMSSQNHYCVQMLHNANKAPVYTLQAMEKTDKQILLYDTGNPAADEYIQAETRFFTIPTDDGYNLPAKWTLPLNFDDSGKTRYPVIFRIYSGPDTPTVKNRFNFRNPWQDSFFAARGVITISVDHRGSGHFGKKGVALMHRKLGSWELKDLITAVKWLRKKPFVDAERMGITGYSYGGYMTLLAMTQGADYFTHGISGAPVTDWIYYDSVYTERYMDTPEQNPQGFKEASILESADQLSGPLLLLHGTTDDNVHFQQSLELVDRLTALNKDFQFMAYPESRHGVKQKSHMNRMEYQFWLRYFHLSEE